MNPLHTAVDRQVSESLALSIEGCELIQSNPYCEILKGHCDGEPVIIKRYRPGQASLARREAEALRAFERFAADKPWIMPTGCIAENERDGSLAIRFVPGERFSSLVYGARSSPETRKRAVACAGLVGQTLPLWRQASTLPGEPLAPFYTEYLRYTSKRLRALPGLGRILFDRAPEEAEQLVQNLGGISDEPSCAHGDLVFRNLHVCGDRIGFIDFANTQPAGHPYDDYWNLWFSLQSMLIPGSFRDALWRAFAAPMDALRLDSTANGFFREYHRRRWLMLRLVSRSAKAWVELLRGMTTFARRADKWEANA